MRVVVDTNLLVGALLSSTSSPARLILLWRAGRFDLLTAAEQLDEIARVTRYPKLRARFSPAVAGRLVNDLRALAVMLDKLPAVDVSPDPDDDYLLAMAIAGSADFLVTGDKRDLLALGATWPAAASAGVCCRSTAVRGRQSIGDSDVSCAAYGRYL